MAEWSKALVLGTSHFGGAGSNPAAVKYFSLYLYLRLRLVSLKRRREIRKFVFIPTK